MSTPINCGSYRLTPYTNTIWITDTRSGDGGTFPWSAFTAAVGKVEDLTPADEPKVAAFFAEHF